jgi:protein SCO1/2
MTTHNTHSSELGQRPGQGGCSSPQAPRPPSPIPRKTRSAILATLFLLTPTVSALAQPTTQPGPLEEVGFDQRLGESVPLDAVFADERGESVALGDFFGHRPVIMALVYYECPMLCTMVLNGLTHTLRTLDFDPGEQFEVVVVSFDTRETPVQASTTRATYLARYDRPGTEEGWHFLTGSEESVRRLTQSLGFRYVWVPESNQFAHAAGIVALTPDGQIARYFYGIEYAPRDVRLGLVEAADDQIGSFVDQVLLYCFHYDPVVGKYSAVAMNIVRLAAAATVVALGSFLILQWRRDRRRRILAPRA